MSDHRSPRPDLPGVDWSRPIVDLGGWISGPCLPNPLPPEAVHPPVLDTVLTVARLGATLPLWRVSETLLGWVAVRVAASGGEPQRLVRAGLPALEEAMTQAELAILKAAHPGWSIRRTEHGRAFTAQAGGPPTLHGRTLGELTAAIRSSEQAGGGQQ